MTKAGTKYHWELEDPASGETLGLLLVETGEDNTVARAAHLSNPYAAKSGSGDMTLSDLTDLSLWSINDWRGGRAQEQGREPDRYYDSRGLETRIAHQVTLGPLVHTSEVGTVPYYAPSSIAGYEVRHSMLEQGGTDGGQYPCSVGEMLAGAFTVPNGMRKIEGVQLYLANGMIGDPEPDATAGAAIYTDNNGLPGSEVVKKSGVAISGTGWVTFTFSSAAAVTPGNKYWVVLIEEDTGVGQVDWYQVEESGAEGAEYDGASWSALSSYSFYFRVDGEELARSMSFDAEAGGTSCTGCRLKLRKSQSLTQSYTIGLYADSGGKPTGSALQSATIGDSDLSTSFAEVRVTWATESLTGSATYHLVLTPPASADDPNAYIEWAGDGSPGYASGAACYKTGGGAWTSDTDTDLYFKINDGPEFPSSFSVSPARFNGNLYCASGDTVYKWNTSTNAWDSVDSQGGETVTALVAFGDYLWAARGANTMRVCNTSDVWANASGSPQRELLWQYNGYLYGTDATNKEQIYYTSDGTNWSDSISAGDSRWPVEGGCGFQDEVVMAKDVGLWMLNYEWAYQVLDWLSLEDSDNGRGIMAWSRTGELFIPIISGIYKWNGTTMVAMGPDQDAGLPDGRAGKVAAMAGTVNWLYAAIDGGSDTSSILAYNGRGWHEIARAESAGDRIRSIMYETVSSPHRLWWGEGKQMKYVEMPDYTDNPWQYSGISYAPSGELVLSWWGGELLQVPKDFRTVVVHCEGCTSDQTIRIYYEVDRSGQWTYLGEINSGGTIHKIDFPRSSFTSVVVGTGSDTNTIELKSGSTTSNMVAGDWVKINGEIRQIESITDSDTFVLETPLSNAPAEDDICYAAAAMGYEIRLKLELATADSSSSPKLLGLAVYYQANTLDRWNIVGSVRVENGMVCLDGSPYPHDAAELEGLLEEWITRPTAFYLHDIRGNTRIVKVSNASEIQVHRASTADGTRYHSVIQLGLIEVGV